MLKQFVVIAAMALASTSLVLAQAKPVSRYPQFSPSVASLPLSLFPSLSLFSCQQDYYGPLPQPFPQGD